MARMKGPMLAILIAAVATMTGAAQPICTAQAQGGCAAECRAAYGSCYKSTANRAACENQMQRCLQGCIASKRG
jgi:hypothetical protein